MESIGALFSLPWYKIGFVKAPTAEYEAAERQVDLEKASSAEHEEHVVERITNRTRKQFYQVNKSFYILFFLSHLDNVSAQKGFHRQEHSEGPKL
jgi:hypothetical protein